MNFGVKYTHIHVTQVKEYERHGWTIDHYSIESKTVRMKKPEPITPTSLGVTEGDLSWDQIMRSLRPT